MSKNGWSSVACAVVVSALSWSLPASADDVAPVRSNLQYLGLNGRILSDGEMSEMRGRFTRGNRATITVDDQVTSDYDPNVPGSASVTVNLGPNTVSRASASTTGTNGYASASVTITGAVITNTGALSASALRTGRR